jgi:hypothetical protein
MRQPCRGREARFLRDARLPSIAEIAQADLETAQADLKLRLYFSCAMNRLATSMLHFSPDAFIAGRYSHFPDHSTGLAR